MNIQQWRSSRLEKLAGLALGAFAIWALVLLAAYHINLINAPVQLEYREGMPLLTTQLLLDGVNPFSATNQPVDINNYGFFYHLVVLPLALVFGNSFQIHRLVSALCILITVVFIISILVRRNTSLPAALGSGVIIAANLLFYTTPLARPDGLGELLFILVTFLPWIGKYTRFSLGVSIVLGVIAFFTKFYFILGVGYTAGYLLFSRRYRAFGIYCLGFVILLSLSALLVLQIFPFYFYDSIYTGLGIAGKKLDFFWNQSALYLLLYAPVILLLAVLGFLWIKKRVTRSRSLRSAWTTVDFPFFGFICSLVVIIGSMGWHPGTLMVYYFQLITPFMLVLLVEVTRGRSWLGLLAKMSLMVCLFGNLILMGINPFDRRSVPWVLLERPIPNLAEWELIRERISQSRQIYNSPVMVGEMVGEQRLVYDNGHTEYYFSNMDKVPNFFLLPPGSLVSQRGHAYINQLEAKVVNRGFDWIVITRDDKGNLMGRPPTEIDLTYLKKDELVIEMPLTFQTWTLEFWEPRQ